MSAKSRLVRHVAPVALAVTAVIAIALKGGSPPTTPCDGEWVCASYVTDGCGNDTNTCAEWKCEKAGDTLSLPISFERNAGQAPGNFQFVSRSRGMSVLLDDGAAELALLAPDGSAARMKLHLDGARSHAEAEGLDPLPGHANYFLGRDSSKWMTNVDSFARVRYKDVYPGIDAIYYGKDGELEHDFVVRPGADPNQIRMVLAGADSPRLEPDGSIAVTAGGVRIAWRRPVVYQLIGGRKRIVESRYRVDADNRVSFTVGDYDRQTLLVIDPAVAYVSYFGRNGADAGGRMVVDSEGNAYTAGITFDGFFPVSAGAPSVAKGNFGDILITKFNPSGTAVLYSTHIGGAFAEGATAIAIDASGNLYLTGTTISDDYPVSSAAFDRFLQPPGAPSDPGDCVVTKLNAAGNAILYSTYAGGTKQDSCTGIAVDSRGSAYVTGFTTSTNFPVTDDAPQRIPRGGSEGFLLKLNPQGSGIEYSTLFGGLRNDGGLAVALDAQGAAYVAGFTVSNFGFPITPGAPQPAWGGARTLTSSGDGFVLKVNPAGNQIVYSTYLGGDRDDAALSIAVDAQGNAYVAGNTNSTNFRTTEGAFQRTPKGAGGNLIYPGGDAFVVKLNPAGNAIVYSTLIGGARDDWASSIAVDAVGNAYVSGSTLSADFPVSQDASQNRFGGTFSNEPFPTGDAFLAQLNPAGAALVYSTYIGGNRDEIGFGIALDKTGAVYVSGSTMSPNFPVTPGAAQTTYGGSARQVVPFGDVFMARFGTPVVDPTVPTIRTFGSAANNLAVSVSPGEWIVIAGANLGPAQRAGYTAADGAVPKSLAGTQVLFDGIAAPVFYASASSVQVAVPFAVAGKASTQVVVDVGGRRSAPLTVPVSATKPTLFSANGQGTGQGLIVNLADNSANGSGSPAYPGDWIAISFTGGGLTDPELLDGQTVPEGGAPITAPVAVTVAGRDVESSYGGAAMGQPAGLYRADVRLPEDLEPGDHEVLLSVGGVRSQTGVTVAVQARPPAPESGQAGSSKRRRDSAPRTK